MRGFNRRRVLFDTNILIDAVDKNRPFSREACLALKHCNGGGDMGLVSPTSLNDAYYILRKYKGEAWAREAVRHLLDLLVVLPFGPEECLISAESNEPDFEDGMIRAAAELNDVDYIITRDKKAFLYARKGKLTCDEYLELIASEDRAITAALAQL